MFTWKSAALASAFASSVATVFSISISQALLGVGLIALLLSGAQFRFPPIGLQLVLFGTGTVLSLLLSDSPAAGLPQLRKLYVFLILLLMASTFRHITHARWLVLAWMVAATMAAIRGFWQFDTKLEQARSHGSDFYVSYVADRITGFMSHWMTFSGLQMIILILGVSLLLFGNCCRGVKWALGIGCVFIGGSIALSLTRGVWIATAFAAIYLLWNWKPWSVLTLPIAAFLLLSAGPPGVRTRLTSFVKPQGELDSNRHRVVCWQTGLVMIREHPWFGLGPEIVGRDFIQYVPDNIGRPLPKGWYGHLHNIYLQYAAERGIPTLMMLLWLVGVTFFRWWNTVRHLPQAHSARWLLHGAIAALGGIMVSGIFEHNLGDSEVLLMTLSVLSLGYLANMEATGSPPST